MEGSSAGPASFGQLDPSIVNGSGPGPMAAVPIGGGPGSPGGGGIPQSMPTPGPAATAMPTPQPQPQVIQSPPPYPNALNPMPPNVPELNAPSESVLLTEMQELKSQFKHVRKITVAQGAILFCLGVAVIFYLTNSVKAKVGVE